jgi:S-DNA-T family DNA segregation ATPase FtsK/SpoIIIE
MAVITATRKRRQGPARRVAASAGSMQAREIAGLALIGVGTFLGMTLFFGVTVGPVGNGLETLVRLAVGRAVALAPVVLVALGVGVILGWEILTRPPFRAGVITLLAAIQLALAGGILGLGGRTRTSWFDTTVMQGRGGLLGEIEYFVTSHTVGGPGTTLVVVLGLIAGAVLVTGASLSLVLRRSGKGAAVAGRAMGRGARAVTMGAVRGGQMLGGQVRTRLEVREDATADMPRKLGTPEPPLDGADQYPDLFTVTGTLPRSPALGPPTEGERLEEPGPGPVEGATASHRAASRAEDDDIAAPPLETLIPPPNPNFGYRTPSKNVLKRSTGPATQPAPLIKETSRRLVETLGHFGVQAEVTEAVSGPRVTRYELQLAPGTKVSRVTALRDDLAYALAAREEIRIIAPIPGKQAVGVEVANPNATMVTLGDLFRDFPEGAGPLMSWLGIDIGGSAVYLDLARMPHILIAGSTGTGKSVCLNAILASILLRATPDDLRMILIDPKKVELNHYEGIPHLLTPVVTNMKNASAVLANVVREMESRYELMGQDRARNLRDWNAIRASRGEKPIPMILVLIDELADLMMVSPAEVEDAIIRLAQKSRAVGIHLVLATQRPSVDVITGMIKANVPSRIAFAVSSQVDSRVVLDATGAESLLGQGDMLFRPIGTSRLQRLQGAYVSEEEILAITDHWRRQGKPELREDLLERPEAPEEDPLDPDADDLIGKAVEMVVTQGTASVSLLQRRLGVGYARAGRLVDMMERMGVISGHEGSKPRTVLIGTADLDRVLRRSEPSGAPDEPELDSVA